jgi:hypothetical protein
MLQQKAPAAGAFCFMAQPQLHLAAFSFRPFSKIFAKTLDSPAARLYDRNVVVSTITYERSRI